jgi:hypothetical protein
MEDDGLVIIPEEPKGKLVAKLIPEKKDIE